MEESDVARPTKVLTVGDGDLTLSLSLARAYGDRLSLTASVLDGRDELLLAYPDAPMKELQERNVDILFELDATQLHRVGTKGSAASPSVDDDATQLLRGETKDGAASADDVLRSWDLVLFHHPHLGLASLEKDEAEHANRHFRLLCHYLYSAGQVSTVVHVCLCGTQAQTWRLQEAAELAGMELVERLPTAVPFSRIWTKRNVVAAPPQFAAPRRYRNGKLGSHHFLGKYGYRHRRTEGSRYSGASSDMNVAGSEHFVLRRKNSPSGLKSRPGAMTCWICNEVFSSESDLELHLTSQARPKQYSTDYATAERGKTTPSEGDNEFQSNWLPSESLVYSPPRTSPSPHGSKKEISANEPVAQSSLPPDSGTQLVVSKEHNSKRLRWFLQHNIKDYSKRLAEKSITAGMVGIDGVIATDSSRILVEGNTVSVVSKNNEDIPPIIIDVLYQKEPYLAVWKPAGLRTKGAFPGTLESIFSKQEESKYVSLSSFETSCPGICVLISNDNDIQDEKNKSVDEGTPIHNITHVITALVHGRVPDDDWSTPTNTILTLKAKWKKKSNSKKRCYDGESVLDGDKIETVQICCKERMIRSSSAAPLSTVTIRAKTPSTSSICQYLRNAGYPVVGDVYCRQEYLQLKRSIRNRIKGKLCIGCYSVEIDGTTVATKSTPDKLSAQYWEKHFCRVEERSKTDM